MVDVTADITKHLGTFKDWVKLLEIGFRILGLTRLNVQNVKGLIMQIYQFNRVSPIFIKGYTH